MILETTDLDPAEFERRTGWSIKPQGACKGDRCVPLPEGGRGRADVRVLAERLEMPLIRDEPSGLWCLGPEAGGRVLESAEAPDFALPDLAGRVFRLSGLRGSKVLLLAWASW
jgi:hypothetical protein